MTTVVRQMRRFRSSDNLVRVERKMLAVHDHVVTIARAFMKPSAMITEKTPLSRMGSRCSTTHLLVILGDGRELEEGLAAQCSATSWHSYRFQTVPADSEGIGTVKSLQPAALLSPYELLGMNALDLFEALLGHELPGGFPAACYGQDFSELDRQRARQLGSVKLLPSGDSLHERIVNWLHDSLVLNRIPTDSMSDGQVCDLLWQRVGKRKVAELEDILPPASKVEPRGNSLCCVSYLNRQFRLLLKDGMVVAIAAD
jgi:hypothetical protein